MSPTRRDFVAGTLAVGIARSADAAATSQVLTPEMFGAKGDGRTNDTKAFAALSSHVNKRGGGTVLLRPVTYVVGEQHSSGTSAFAPSDILHFIGCPQAVVVRGNGATLRCAAGLRYGGFDRSGTALPPSRDNLKESNRATPYVGMIFVERCTGLVEISNVTLDGNMGAMRIGGRYGTGGWQAAASGLRLTGNRGPERISQVRSHHHPQDGLLLTGAITRVGQTIVSDCAFEDNARQGCTVASGRDIGFERCRFNRTGRAAPLFRSNPGAGVDIEPQGTSVRNVSFTDCEMVDNAGFGLAAGAGDSAGVSFSRCKFIATSNWAAWPNRPHMRFDHCLFVGQVVHAYGDVDPMRAAQFIRCTFTDDPKLSPTGKVFLGRTKDRAIAVLTDGQNVRFTECEFRLVGPGLLPRSGPDVIYADCTMSQRSAGRSKPLGTYVGTTSIEGNADLDGSIIRGTVILNGKAVPTSRSGSA